MSDNEAPAASLDNEALVKKLIDRDYNAKGMAQMYGADSLVKYAVENGPVKHAAPFTEAEADEIVAWWLSPVEPGNGCTCGDDEPLFRNRAEALQCLDNMLDLVKRWAVPTMAYVKAETEAKYRPDMLRGLKEALMTAAAQSAWGDLEAAVEGIRAALSVPATNGEGEPLYLHMPEDGAWVATAIAPPEGAEGYKPLYV